jgi:hypothetical protein
MPRVFFLRTDKASKTLKGLKNMLLFAAETACRFGEASPTAVIAEIRGVANYLALRWKEKSRWDVQKMSMSKLEP